MSDAAFWFAAAAVLIFSIGTCGGVFTKTGPEKCAASCGASRMSRWTDGSWNPSRLEECQCLEGNK